MKRSEIMEAKLKVKPPIYFLAGILLIPICYFAIPQLNIITFPYLLLGILPILGGLYLLYISYDLFLKKGTPEDYSPPTCIVDCGIYRYTRNPMYVAGVLMLLGEAICFGNLAGFISPVLFFLLAQIYYIPFEENMMENMFKEEYLRYKSSVRRWI